MAVGAVADVGRAGWAARRLPGQVATASAPVVGTRSHTWRVNPVIRKSAPSAARRWFAGESWLDVASSCGYRQRHGIICRVSGNVHDRDVFDSGIGVLSHAEDVGAWFCIWGNRKVKVQQHSIAWLPARRWPSYSVELSPTLSCLIFKMMEPMHICIKWALRCLPMEYDVRRRARLNRSGHTVSQQSDP